MRQKTNVFKEILKFKKTNSLSKQQRELKDEEGNSIYSAYTGEYEIDVISAIDPGLPYIRGVEKNPSSKRKRKEEKAKQKSSSTTTIKKKSLRRKKNAASEESRK